MLIKASPVEISIHVSLSKSCFKIAYSLSLANSCLLIFYCSLSSFVLISEGISSLLCSFICLMKKPLSFPKESILVLFMCVRTVYFLCLVEISSLSCISLFLNSFISTALVNTFKIDFSSFDWTEEFGQFAFTSARSFWMHKESSFIGFYSLDFELVL